MSDRVELIQHKNAYSFDRRVRDFLLRNEALHHAILSHCYALAYTPPEPLKQSLDLLTLESNQEVVAVAINPSGKSIFISMLTHLSGVDLLAEHLKRHSTLSMVNAPPEIAQRFAQIWTQIAGQPHTPETTLCAYRLEQLRPFTWAPGQLRQATETDVSLVSQWYAAFSEEALGRLPNDCQAWATRQIDGGHVFLWQDGEPVSMGCTIGQTANGFRVSIVFTPKEHRQKGYGKTCTAALTQRLLNDGQRYCFLYADKNNAFSTRMYEAMGYELMGETQNYRFA
ncbi:GNAT family N-acetyltransferase [Scytonema sp. NUACC26]|uniref:GNAT family N-acetyltransferase n=1 Tax=Scytonema sp. NUACC26 TaxID=3140176 RepID=UPI0034DB8E01